MTVRRQTIAPRPADLLHITLETLWHVIMNDSSNIGFIQAHTKRNRRHHYTKLTPHELRLDFLPLCRWKTRVVALGLPRTRGVFAPFWFRRFGFSTIRGGVALEYKWKLLKRCIWCTKFWHSRQKKKKTLKLSREICCICQNCSCFCIF